MRLLRRLAPYVLDVAGLSCLAAAAFLVALPLGLAVAGVGAIVLQWRIRG